MTQAIIFPQDNGSIAIVYPTGELPIEAVAQKDVPAGVPYLFATTNDVPTDRTFRGAWEADFTTPDGFGLGADAYFAAKEAEEAAVAEQTVGVAAEGASE
jgi:hypothetical protein